MPNKLTDRTMMQLFSDWDFVECFPNSEPFFAVRVALIAEFKRRDAEAFSRWTQARIHSQNPDDRSPRKWFAVDVAHGDARL